ncbi:MAG: hypothetical protein LBK66_03120 [Spirochaetaceae bacterium]|jgi:hypothetical protein|nr:hypothetical protein [Spirochaetaceae bacterium]
MIILRESKEPLFEVVQLAGNTEYRILLNQMGSSPVLAQTLNAPIGTIPKYRYLIDSLWLSRASLLQIIKGTMERPGFESYFVKSPKGLYVGFIAILIANEDGKSVVNDVKTFSFGLDNSDDENQMYKDLPAFLDKCLAKYKKVSWTALEGNKANRAYEIYTKRRKGTISKDGKYIRYTCAE